MDQLEGHLKGNMYSFDLKEFQLQKNYFMLIDIASF